ncbi:MAG TPA: hypothetical protein VN832_14315 [Stellaceae bacterium]|nr:hypothetical protein [Stellaceae bacterium]
MNELVGKMVGEMGAAMSAALIVQGDRLLADRTRPQTLLLDRYC